MSIEMVAAVLGADLRLGSTAKLVLLGLANHGGPDGTHAFPSVERLAGYAEVDRRTVQRCLRTLEAEGYIRTVQKAGRHRPKEYELATERLRGDKLPLHAEATPVGVTSQALRGDISGTSGATPMPPEPSLEPSTTVKNKSLTAEREKNPIFEALVTACGMVPPHTEVGARSIAVAAAELKKQGATADEVLRRAENWSFPAQMTPWAIAKWWGLLVAPHVPKASPKYDPAAARLRRVAVEEGLAGVGQVGEVT